MYRSFDNRLFAGLCGGLAALLPVNAWVFRTLFMVLTLVTGGIFAALYILLWWIIPQENPVGRRRGGSGLFLLTLILTALTLAGWWLAQSGQLPTINGVGLLWPVLLVVLASVFFLRQIRG
ncbi:MAG: PspC domain-containing protein [Anaerolineae bacterium]|nr:PspC domain-containing protein [Anaerolineae bacterium]